MLKNYVKIAFRNLIKHKTYSFINIVGLAVGLTCVIFLMLFLYNELSYDRFYENSPNIYRVVSGKTDASEPNSAQVPPSLAEVMKNTFPDIQDIARLYKEWGTVTIGQQKIVEENCIRADASLFSIFSFSFLDGDPQTALTEPYTVVISKRTAEKYFHSQDVVGKELVINRRNHKITGIIENISPQSHLTFDICLSMLSGRRHTMTDAFPVYTYFSLPEGVSVENVSAGFPDLVAHYIGSPTYHIQYHKYYFQKLTDIHLHSHLDWEFEANQKISTIYIFALIAILILVIACFNFINLSTARASTRSHEIGIRKTVGAVRKQLLAQFLGESFLITLSALALAIGLVELLLPSFNSYTGKELSLSFGNTILTSLTLLGIALVVSTLAGFYPAFVLAKFRPVAILKGEPLQHKRHLPLRTGLVVLQFSISIALLIVFAVIFRQFNFMRQADPGYNEEHVLVIENPSADTVLKNELSRHPHIVKISKTNTVPGKNPKQGYWTTNRDVQYGQKIVHEIMADANFVSLMELKILQGRDFDLTMGTDANHAIILNESAAKVFELEKPLDHFIQSTRLSTFDGRTTQTFQTTGNIIGVVNDFHVQPLHFPIQPTVIHLGYVPGVEKHQEGMSYLLVRIEAGTVDAVLKSAEKEFKKVYPGKTFEYSFLDKQFEIHYRNEMRLSRIFAFFTSIALFISCLGLLGLAIFAATRKTKEIGIRKVMGASESKVAYDLSAHFLRWVLLANIIAWPIAWFTMNKWLQNFAYRINLSWWLFVVSGFVALVIAFFTVSWQALRAARANPVEALRYE